MSNDLLELLGATLNKPDGSEVATSAALENKDVIGLYFSAHWCPPCRGFTPQLGKKYEALLAAGKRLEIVFVSSDRDDKAFKEYHAEQPWLALPFAERDAKGKLSEKFGVRGIPTLVFCDAKTGQTITTEGRSGVSAPSFVEDFPYHPKPVNDLSASTSGINNTASLVVLMESADADTKKQTTAMLTEIAEKKLAEAEEKTGGVAKFFTGCGGGPTPQIRKMCGLPNVVVKHEHALEEKPQGGGWGCDGCGQSGSGKTRFRCAEGCDFDFCGVCHEAAGKSSGESAPLMVILDLADDGACYNPLEGKATVTADNVAAFLADYADGKLSKISAEPE